ncbi:cysteine-rich venom protein 6-like [Zophobas morio]|uniref:cysteine-rich venom protein 6-like n=1 Tax=Zophobas morio TaxID=2755281 RepID=UPI0030827FDF
MISIILLAFWATPVLLDTPTCGPNEIYDECGTYCPLTCLVQSPQMCLDGWCIRGCFCEKGYVRENLNGKCIPTSDCGSACRENEKFDICGSSCPPTCDNPSLSCPAVRCSQGCFCAEGYILTGGSTRCIKLEDCPRYPYP